MYSVFIIHYTLYKNYLKTKTKDRNGHAPMLNAPWTLSQIDPSLHFRHFLQNIFYMNENWHKNRQNEITYLMQNVDNGKVSGTVNVHKMNMYNELFFFMQNVYIYEWCRWWYPGCVLNLIHNHNSKNISEFNEFSVENISIHSPSLRLCFEFWTFLNDSKKPFISFDLSTIQFEVFFLCVIQLVHHK